VHFFKLNATENTSAARAARWAALADSDSSQFYRTRDANREWFKDNDLHFSLGFLYNPIGKILVAIATPQNDTYSLRVYDVAAYQRLVNLSYELRRQHIATADVAPFLLAHPEWSTHPVDGKPFRWNPETAELAVNTLAEHPKDQRFSVFVGLAARASVPSAGTASRRP
jgi:alpha-ketoglutarate-dependent taurine dioxygenase